MKTNRVSGTAMVLALIVGAGAAVRFWGLDFGLPNTDVRPDEVALVSVSMALLFQGLNPKFFDWPSLEFYVLAALYRLRWEVGHWQGYFQHKWQITAAVVGNPKPYFLFPRAIAAVSGTVSIWIVYRVASRLTDRLTGVVAALFLAVAFLHVRDSHFGVTDVPATALAIAAMLPLTSAFLDPASRRHWTRGGLLTGLAASAKYGAGIVAVVGIVIAVIARSERRLVVGHFVRFMIWSVIGFLIGTPFALLDFPRFWQALSFDQSHLMTGHGTLVGRGWVQHLVFSLRYGLGTPMLAAALVGFAVLFAQSWKRALVVCSFPILFYVLTGQGQTVFVRYIVPIVPFVCITAAVAVVEACRLVTRVVPLNLVACTTVAASLVALPSITSVVQFDRLLAKPDSRELARAWIDARRQPGDWLHEESGIQVYPDFGRPQDLHVSTFDAGRRVFLSEDGTIVSPAWVVLGRSPLVGYTTFPPELLEVVEQQFTRVAVFRPTTGDESPDTFDQQDKFFLPYRDFSQRLRPGPEIHVFRRR